MLLSITARSRLVIMTAVILVLTAVALPAPTYDHITHNQELTVAIVTPCRAVATTNKPKVTADVYSTPVDVDGVTNHVLELLRDEGFEIWKTSAVSLDRSFQILYDQCSVGSKHMPWQKRFDVDQARQQAMQAFWARGYESTSMQDLLDCMGINRGSFYDTFKSKHQVLIEALQQYDATRRIAWLEEARRRRSPKATIETIFRSVANAADGGASPRGCFIVNCALELAPKNSEVAAIVNRAFSETESFFRLVIEEGQAIGEIPSHVDAAKVARALLGMLLGMRVLSRAGAAKGVLETIATGAVGLLR